MCRRRAEKEADIAIGNVVGSNIFNLLGIVGVTALAVPLSAPGISMVDPLIMIGFAVVLLPLLWSGFLLKRWEGTVLLITYIGHTLYHWTTG